MTKNLFENLPEELKDRLGEFTWSKVNVKSFGSLVFVVNNVQGKKILKVLKHNRYSSLFLEAQKIRWLQGRIPVPKVLYYTKDQENEYLVLSYTDGVNAFDESLSKNYDRVVKLLAEGLKQIHSIDVSDCPFKESIDARIESAERKLKAKVLDEARFICNFGRPPYEIFEEMIRVKPKNVDLVFTHGDYCLPNVLIKNNAICGFVDLGAAGVADRYQDISLGVWSLEYNKKERYILAFLAHYGIKMLDQDRNRFFRYLHSFSAFIKREDKNIV